MTRLGGVTEISRGKIIKESENEVVLGAKNALKQSRERGVGHLLEELGKELEVKRGITAEDFLGGQKREPHQISMGQLQRWTRAQGLELHPMQVRGLSFGDVIFTIQSVSSFQKLLREE